MPGSRQGDAIRFLLRKRLVPPAPTRFEEAGTHPRTGSKKIRCRLCHMEGYGPLDPMFPGEHPAPWQLEHLLPHAYVCHNRECQMAFTNASRWAAHMMQERHER